MVKLDLVGKRFGKLVVVSEAPTRRGKNGQSARMWNCICDCGNIYTQRTANITRKTHAVLSCGCLWSERMKAQVGEKAFGWKGGYHIDDGGYAQLYLPKHPRAKSNGYVREHIVVMERVLGRPLLKGEEVHHKNGVKHDNIPSNLELWIKSHPAGQRPKDLVAWAKQILETYEKIIDA